MKSILAKFFRAHDQQQAPGVMVQDQNPSKSRFVDIIATR
jgi:hypothetical protein